MHEEFKTTFPIIHIAFAIFKNHEYLDAIGLQRLLWKYHESIGHPFANVLRQTFPNLIGEDIELANRALSHSVRSKRGQADLAHLDNSYRWLGCLLRHKETQRLNLVQSRSLKGWETKKRLKYRLDYSFSYVLLRHGEDCVLWGAAWMREVLNGFRDGTWQHYQMPVKETRRRTRFIAVDTEKKDIEEEQLQLTPVSYIHARN